MRNAMVCLAAMVSGIVGLAAPAPADTALILANVRYDDAPDLRSVREIRRLEDDLEEAGFDVIQIGNGDTSEMRAGLARLMRSGEEGRVLIVAAGHFVRGRRDSWLLSSDDGIPDLPRADLAGVPVSLMLEVAAMVPGRGVVALATDDVAFRTGPGLQGGIGRTEPPQGVTVLGGSPSDIAEFIAGPLLTPGTDLPSVLEAYDGIQAVGFLSSAVPFTDTPSGPSGPAPEASTGDRDLWRAMNAIGTAAAYSAYLDRFPQGAFADRARARIVALNEASEVADGPEAREDALDLTREDRRDVQRFLTILGFDTGGVDGIFGPATREAIADWQRARSLRPTGYLGPRTLQTLRGEGEIREAVLAEERRNLERQDREYWRQTGSGSSVAGAEAYLDRYPNGLFAGEARDILARDADAAVDRAWAEARNNDTLRAYREFIRAFPDADQVPEARARIRDLRLTEDVEPEVLRRAREAEASLNLAPVSRLLVERRLAVSGFDPGPIDGTFDAASRRAIAEYQDSRGMAPTGYVDDVMLAMILAMSLGDIIRQ